jgi:hypothetical protein
MNSGIKKIDVMEQLFLIIICAVALVVAAFLFKSARSNRVSTRIWISGSIAVVMIPFGMAWLVTSIEEGEPFAGYMGLIVFSGLGIISALVARNQSITENSATSENKVRDRSGKSTSLVLTFLVGVLCLLGGVLLPITFGANRLVSKIDSKEKIRTEVQGKVLSDEALPNFIKGVLKYETLYGEYPERLEDRLIMSMVSGTKDAELLRLLTKVAPESERFALLDKALESFSGWMDNDAPYPHLILELNVYPSRLKEDPEFVMAWLYDNFAFPDMDSTSMAKVRSGEFSDVLDDYMTTPPDDLKEVMIVHGAMALRATIEAADIPERVVLAEQMKTAISPMDAVEKKKTIPMAFSVLKMIWLIPVILLALALVLILWKFSNRIKGLGIFLFSLGMILLLLSNPLRDISTTVHEILMNLGENAPPPALALLSQIFPEVFTSMAKVLLPLGQAILWFGLSALLFAYRHRMWDFFAEMIHRITSNPGSVSEDQ